MADDSQFNTRRGGAGGANEFTRLFGQMMMMPFSTFTYSINLLMQMMQGMQASAGRGIDAADAGAQTFRQPTTRTEDRSMSDQSWGNRGQGGGNWGGGGGGQQQQQQGGGQQGGGQQGWSVREDCRNLEPCDQLRLVRYKILFLKRDLEIAFPEEEELVAEEMNEQGFVAWKIAEFIQKMSRHEVELPRKWKNYPPPSDIYTDPTTHKRYVAALPDQDKRFLRVYVQVLASYDRERTYYERDQIKVLEQIRDRLG